MFLTDLDVLRLGCAITGFSILVRLKSGRELCRHHYMFKPKPFITKRPLQLVAKAVSRTRIVKWLYVHLP